MIAGQWTHLILGGARSGKSRYALAAARGAAGPRTVFLATAQSSDPDMASRIASHRRERPSAWRTVEEPFDLVGACRRLLAEADLIVVDCLTLWVSNRLLRGDEDLVLLSDIDDLTRFLSEHPLSCVIVSNEVGEGVHPTTPIGRRFRDTLGLVNQRVAEAADLVTLMVAGIPIRVKAPSSVSSAFPASAHDSAQQAP